MKKMIKTIIFSIICLSFLSPNISLADTLSKRLSGNILLQVQAHGEAWYVYPVNSQRYYMGRPLDAFQLMRNLSLGISNKDFDSFNGTAPVRLAGRILLKPQDLGKAYYVNPTTRKMTFLNRPNDAFRIMREQSLGISNPSLSLIPVSGASAIPPSDAMNITVTQPMHNSSASLPLLIKGEDRVFENTVNIRLKDSAGNVLAEEFTTAMSPDIGLFGPFEKYISYSASKTNTGVLEVFTLSAKDGAEIDKVIISLSLPTISDTSTIKVFFSNSKQDPGALNCDQTFSVDRLIASTPAIGITAINLMLAGPLSKEQSAGYFTNIATGTTLQSLNISDGVARADFNSTLDANVAGSCRVQAIRSQITKTLTQFPSVNSVIISINGETDEILQP